MIDIIVQRDDGDFPGEDVQDPLLCELSVALQRGRNLIDSNSRLQEVEIEAVLRPSTARGSIAEVHDALRGKTLKGKIVGVTHSVVSGGDHTTVFRMVKAEQ